MSHDLFDSSAPATESYNASQIEVLEGLEPVRRRPGMYIGGTDERALHHLVAANQADGAVVGGCQRPQTRRLSAQGIPAEQDRYTRDQRCDERRQPPYRDPIRCPAERQNQRQQKQRLLFAGELRQVAPGLIEPETLVVAAARKSN